MVIKWENNDFLGKLLEVYDWMYFIMFINEWF